MTLCGHLSKMQQVAVSASDGLIVADYIVILLYGITHQLSMLIRYELGNFRSDRMPNCRC